MIATYIHQLSPLIFELPAGWGVGRFKISEGVGPHWYGMAYVISFALAYWLFRKLSERGYNDMPPKQVGDFITLTAVFGVMLGGRLGWVIFYAWREIIEDPVKLLQVWKGGMSSHGGLLGVGLFMLFWARRHKLSWIGIGDSMCVVAPMGLFLVRCANFINGELFGKPAGLPGEAPSVPWAVIFPQELKERPPLDLIRNDEGIRQFLLEVLPPRHPSQLYEALLEGVLLGAIMLFLRFRMRLPRGVITGLFFILYAILRIVGETFREPDPAWSVGPLSAGQFLSLFMIVIGAAFLAWGLRARQYERAHSTSDL